MSDARANIMARLKATLDKRHNPTVRLSGADQCMKAPVPGPIPKRGHSMGQARVELFADEAIRVSAQVMRLDKMSDVPTAAKKVLHDAGADRLKVAANPALEALDWSGVEVAFGIGHGDDAVGLSLAYAGVAETGTLVLRSGADTPTTLNFLPDVHVVVIHAGDIEANYEDVWAKLRVAGSGNAVVMPRTVNWITGPSRTADIEQTILLGAHGPRKLVILLVDEET